MVAQFLIPAAANLIGGLMGQNAADENRASQERQAELNRAMQIQFAKEGIRWKVEDAKAAGVHPLYALGAQGASYAPVSIGSSSGSPMGSALASMGQDIGRAVNATQTAPERMSGYAEQASRLQLDNMSLQNMLLASRVKLLNQSGGNPPLPSIGDLPPVPEDSKQKERPPLQMEGERWLTSPGTSNMEAWEDRYGDDGPVTWITQAGVALSDLKRNYGQPQTWPTQLMHTLWNRLSAEAREEAGNFKNFMRKLKQIAP